MNKDKKLYQVINGCGRFYAIATSFDKAAAAVEERLNSSNYGYSNQRGTVEVKLMAIEHFFLEDRQQFSDDKDNLVIVNEE